jgi:hypothetical protein
MFDSSYFDNCFAFILVLLVINFNLISTGGGRGGWKYYRPFLGVEINLSLIIVASVVIFDRKLRLRPLSPSRRTHFYLGGRRS